MKLFLNVVPELDTDSFLKAVLRVIAEKDKLSTRISNNGTEFSQSEQKFTLYVAAWIQ